jgi:putative transposase
MPSRNTIKLDVSESYYHVYARGLCKQQIFVDQSDYVFFINLFSRYLSAGERKSPSGPYPHYHNQVELLCYCLMPNHFHLLLYQKDEKAMSNLMRSVMTSYSRYFNKMRKRTGPLFESRYKAVRIDAQNQLEHVSRYIHLNPRYWKRYPHSSIAWYRHGEEPEWLKTDRILGLFKSRNDYVYFLEDYENIRNMLKEIRRELADG